MKFLPTLLLFALCGHVAQAQLSPTLAACAGGYESNTRYTLSWSIGEPVVATLSQSRYTLSQGFQNPVMQAPPVQLASLLDQTRIMVYPNPFAQVLRISISRMPAAPLQLRLSDARGQLLQSAAITGPDTELRVADLPAGPYFLHLLSEQASYVFPIVKR